MNTSTVTRSTRTAKIRRYDATRRRDAAARTRERVLDVAKDSLLSQGYAATTVAAIARAAGVSAELIYKSFGGKAGLVRHLQRRALLGDGPTPAEARSDAASASEVGAAAVIREWARLATEVAPRVSSIMVLVGSAAASDPVLADLLGEMNAQRLERMAHNAERISRHPDVRSDLTVDQVRDILWTYSSPDLYRLVVLERGWTLSAYGDFLWSGMTGQLLTR